MTALARSPTQHQLGVGYADGTVRLFDLSNGDLVVSFSGHKSAVTALNYDHEGVRLVSGAKVRIMLQVLS